MTPTLSHLFCTRPFEWSEIHPDGSVFLCCPAWQKRPLGNLWTDDVATLWNGPAARQVRGDVLAGSFATCRRDRCPHLARGGGGPLLPRSALTGEWPAIVRAQRTTLNLGPRRLNLCIDPSCNLACPSCRGEVRIVDGPERTRVEQLLSLITAGLGPTLEELNIGGYGDPFGSPTLFSWLSNFPRLDFPRLRRLHLHTNGLLWTCTRWQNLSPLHPLIDSAEISVDAATPASYAANRGADFALLRERLAFIASLGLSLKLSCVVQANNCRELVAFAELATTYSATAYFSALVNWGTFSREEYHRRAVHHPEHPEHPGLLDELRRLTRFPHVELGNLSPLISDSTDKTARRLLPHGG